MRKPILIGRRTEDSQWEIIAGPDVSPKDQRGILRQLREQRKTGDIEYDEVLGYYEHHKRLKPKFTGKLVIEEDKIPTGPEVEEPLLPQPRTGKKKPGRPKKKDNFQDNFLS